MVNYFVLHVCRECKQVTLICDCLENGKFYFCAQASEVKCLLTS